MEIITNSRMQSASCPRREHLSYGIGIRKEKDALPLRIGDAFHLGLDMYKQYQIDNEQKVPPTEWCNEIILAVYAEFDKTMPTEDDYAYQHSIDRITVGTMLSAYFWRWSEIDAHNEVIATESVFQMPILNPDTNHPMQKIVASGKQDGIIKLADGRLALLEHKTSGEDLSPEKDFWKALRIDGQISLYWLAANHNGYNIDTVLYDVIKKPTIKPLLIPKLDKEKKKQVVDINTGERILNKDGSVKQSVNNKETQAMITRPETPEEFGQRYLEQIYEDPDRFLIRKEIPRLRCDLDEYKYDMYQTAQQLRFNNNKKCWPRKDSLCRGRYVCQYLDLCCNGFDINSNEVPQGYVTVDDVHPELKE